MKKELIILVYYVNTRDTAPPDVVKIMQQIRNGFKSVFEKINETMPEKEFMGFIVPTPENSRIECIYPKDVDQDLLSKIQEIQKLTESYYDTYRTENEV